MPFLCKVGSNKQTGCKMRGGDRRRRTKDTPEKLPMQCVDILETVEELDFL